MYAIPYQFSYAHLEVALKFQTITWNELGYKIVLYFNTGSTCDNSQKTRCLKRCVDKTNSILPTTTNNSSNYS